jgi:hypothetical protein
MNEHSGGQRGELLARIEMRRVSIDEYLQKARPRGGRLMTVAIVSSAIAAALTAGPALGGETFTEVVSKGLALPSDLLVWRFLCLFALVVSIIAAISTNLARSQDTERKIAAAESASAELEGLSTLVAFGQVPVGAAAKQYQQFVSKIPWVDERHPLQVGDPVFAPPNRYPGTPPRRGPPAEPRGWARPGSAPRPNLRGRGRQL